MKGFLASSSVPTKFVYHEIDKLKSPHDLELTDNEMFIPEPDLSSLRLFPALSKIGYHGIMKDCYIVGTSDPTKIVCVGCKQECKYPIGVERVVHTISYFNPVSEKRCSHRIQGYKLKIFKLSYKKST